MQTFRYGVVLAVAALMSAAGPAAGSARAFPERIPLPDGWRPEGIAVGRGTTFYVGSLADGAVYKGDLRTGTGAVHVAGEKGQITVGVAVDARDRVFAAGGNTGRARVFDATGALLRSYDFGGGFVNDVVVTRTAAWFTDSFTPVLYRVAIGAGGTLGDFTTVPLHGDLQMGQGFNLNGIDATPDGRTLVVVQSNTGHLFTVDTATGATQRIDLGGQTLERGDGILLQGRTLWVVQNAFNTVATVALAPDLAAGEVVARTTDPAFDVPTTVAAHGSRLYLVNARFSTQPTPETTYDVVQIDKR